MGDVELPLPFALRTVGGNEKDSKARAGSP